MKPRAELLESLGALLDVVRNARYQARDANELDIVRELDHCFEIAQSARLRAIKSVSPWMSHQHRAPKVFS